MALAISLTMCREDVKSVCSQHPWLQVERPSLQYLGNIYVVYTIGHPLAVWPWPGHLTSVHPHTLSGDRQIFLRTFTSNNIDDTFNNIQKSNDEQMTI